MKFMPAIAAEALGPRPTLESYDELSLEGIVDKAKKAIGVLKEKFTPSDADKLQAEVTAKLAILERQRKVLEKSKAAVSSSRDDKQHKVKTSRVTHCNFSASTPAEVIAGMQRNRRLVSTSITRVKNAKSKTEVQSVHDTLEADFAKKGQVAKEIMVTRGEALKVLDESIMLNELMQQYCKLMGELSQTKVSHESLSMEGFGSALVMAITVFAYICFLVVIYFVTILLWALVFTNPFMGIPLMILWFTLLILISSESSEQEQAEHLYAEAHKR
jgi:hypothetical protein